MVVALLVDLADEVVFEFSLPLVGAHKMIELMLVVVVHRVLVLFVRLSYSSLYFTP